MRENAKETGAIEEFEKTGKVPNSYLEYEQAYYSKIFSQKNPSKAVFELYDGRLSGDFTVVPYFTPVPFLGNMKNRVSSVWDWGTGAVMTLYDKAFFRGYLGTHIFTPLLASWYLPSTIENRTESVVTY